MSNKKKEVKIAAFDFDYTIINANSNNYLNKLVIQKEQILISKNSQKQLTPSIAQLNLYKYGNEIENLSNKLNNTIRMNAVFKYMHSKYNIGEKEMTKCLSEIKISDSMKKLFNLLKDQGYDLIIISDSNKFLINTILKANNLDDTIFSYEKIYANEARFDQNGCLEVIPYSEIFLTSMNCFFECETKYCRQNMCKGAILENYLNKQRKNEFEVKNVIYVGDGHIDYCPGLHLTKNDLFFVKINSSLFKLINNDTKLKENISASIKYWKNADEISKQLS